MTHSGSTILDAPLQKAIGLHWTSGSVALWVQPFWFFVILACILLMCLFRNLRQL